MRFLHTGDWHIGRTIRGRSRLDEFAAALDEVVAMAVDREVDAVLVAGDIYDQRAVAAEADALVFDSFLRLHDKGVAVVAIPGNHDSALRLGAMAPLLNRVGVTVVAKMRPPGQGGMVRLPARDGSTEACIACVPFVSPRRFSDAAQLFEDVSAGYVDFDSGMGDLLAAYAASFKDDAVNLMLGHMFVSGAEPGGGEHQITIGAEYAVSPARLPGTAHYIALGHIHKPQAVRGAGGPARYCGSLLQLDFGERAQKKSVVIVDATPGRRAQTEQIPVSAGRELRDVVGTIDELSGLGVGLGDAYLRVTVKVDRPVSGIADRVREVLPNALDVKLDYDRELSEPLQTSLRSLEPSEQFVAYYKDTHGSPPADEMVGAFARVYEEVTG